MDTDGFEEEYRSLQRDSNSALFDVPLSESFVEQRGATPFGLRFSYSDLNEDFSTKLRNTLRECQQKNVMMVPYTGIRDPWEQARLWRQSRTTTTVEKAIDRLRKDGAEFLAKVLKDVGPQSGEHVTNALPGFSWHQHGEAADCYWQKDGAPEWDNLEGYKVYAEIAVEQGLTAGGYWAGLKDWPHVQLRSAAGPGSVYSAAEIDVLMRSLFGRSSSSVPQVV